MIESATKRRVYRFNDIRFIPDRQLLYQGDTRLHAGSRQLALLQVLVSRAGETVSKQELLDLAWPNKTPPDHNLKVNIAALRRVLGANEPSVIATVPGEGYRFVGRLQLHDDSADECAITTKNLQSGELPFVSSIIGRREAISDIGRNLRSKGQITIVGPAGVGKTTVAVAVAEDVAEQYPDGVCFVDLSGIDEPQDVPVAIAFALGAQNSKTDPFSELARILRESRLLLLLDNCEHVLSAATTAVEHVRKVAPTTHILVTSREPLRSKVETTYRLPVLDCPAPGQIVDASTALSYSAIELFVKRAEQIHGFNFADTDAGTVAEICRRLDGVALAIELAVSRLGTFSISSLSDQLDDMFALLEQESECGPSRHHTLHSTLGWSYRLLSETEARLFRHLSVFTGTFSVNDVVGMSSQIFGGAEEIAGCTGSLAEKSLLTASYRSTSMRYRFLDLTRSYACENLRASGELQNVLRAYVTYLLGVFKKAESEWHWRSRSEWLSLYAHWLADIRKALDWSFGKNGDGRLGVALTSVVTPLWEELSLVSESRVRIEQALKEFEREGMSDAEMEMKLNFSYAAALNSSIMVGLDVEKVWLKAHGLADQLENVDYQLRTLWGLALAQSYSGAHSRALATLEKFTKIALRENDHSALPAGKKLRFMIMLYCGDIRGAFDGLTSLAERYGSTSDERRVTRFQTDRLVGIHVALSLAVWLTGDHRRALRLAHQALDRAKTLDHRVSQLEALAIAVLPMTLKLGRYEEARSHATSLAQKLISRDILVWRPLARFFNSTIELHDGQTDALDNMRSAIDQLIENRQLNRVPIYLAIAADAALHLGRTDDAKHDIEQAFRYAHQLEEIWCLPELFRIRARKHRSDGMLAEAERDLLEAISIASKSGSISFQLRAATELAELLAELGRFSEAVSHLLPLYDRFDSTSYSPDIQTAGELLERLQASSRDNDGY